MTLTRQEIYEDARDRAYADRASGAIPGPMSFRRMQRMVAIALEKGKLVELSIAYSQFLDPAGCLQLAYDHLHQTKKATP